MSRVYFFLPFMYNISITGGILENKLYFRPANYGKGQRKYKEKPASAKKQTSDKKNHRARNLVLFLLLLAIIVAVIIWLLHGQTVTSGKYPENIKNESLTCISSQIQYEKTSWIDSEEKELKINAIFNGEESLKTLSLIYTLTFESESDAYYAEAKSHAQLNEGFAAVGYDVRKFSNKFSRYDNQLIITLTATKTELDEYSASYFLLPTDENGFHIKTLSDFRTAFEANGMNCSSSTEN